MVFIRLLRLYRPGGSPGAATGAGPALVSARQ